MKNRILSLLLLLCIVLSCVVSCVTPGGENPEPTGHVDYVSELKLDMNSSTKKQEVTVKTFIDGDTTHFNAPTSVATNGVLKARYLAVNTPESTGKIEPYGKTASDFTKETLASAAKILVESDDDKWNLDSTGGRVLVWVWYKPTESADWRCLNLELLQNGLGIASNSGDNRYGKTCVAAIDQAKAELLLCHSGKKDPNFFYGSAQELTLRELRTNIETYMNTKVAFSGVITRDFNNGVYIEDYDEELDLYFGMYVYYQYNLPGQGLEILKPGNEVRIVGDVTEFNGSYQVSGLSYKVMKPNDPDNIQKLSEGHDPAYYLTTAERFASTLKVEVDEELVDKKYAELALGSTISMKDLVVKSIYVTSNGGESDGAMTITCMVDGIEVDVRTDVLRDESGAIITKDRYEGKTIDVQGVVDCFNGDYQIKVFSVNDIEIQ